MTAESHSNQTYPSTLGRILEDETVSGRYTLRFARDLNDLDAVLRLRYEVFNVELNEGLDVSAQTQRDRDEFDLGCHHLMVIETATGRVIGTYRMQTRAMADAHAGFYSAGEFDLSGFPDDILNHAVELGRACIERSHRNGRVLFLLWRGVCLYLLKNDKRYFFGCCSLGSQDPAEGKRLMNHFYEAQHVHPEVLVNPQPANICHGDALAVDDAYVVHIPELTQLYLNYGAKICSPPAIDRLFKTIDYLTLFDLQNADLHAMRRFLR